MSPQPLRISPRTQNLLNILVRYKSILLGAFTLGIFLVAIVACRHLLAEIKPEGLHAAWQQIPRSRLALAALICAGGCLTWLAYEWSAKRYAQANLSTRSWCFGGFCAIAVGNALGLTPLTAGGIRYRLYQPQGVDTLDIARMTLFTSLSLACSIPALSAAFILLSPQAAGRALHLAPSLTILIALSTLGIYAAVFTLAKRVSKAGRLRLLHRLHRPGRRLLSLQLLISLLDMLCAGGVLYVLLPEPPPFLGFLLIYMLALSAGLLSHVPGGAGVFEALILAAYGQAQGAPLAAALLLYRLIYVLAPFLLACLLLLVREARVLHSRIGIGSRQAAGHLAAPILAALVLLDGLMLVLSGSTRDLTGNLYLLHAIVPHALIEISHLGASLIGVLLLPLAYGLYRRLSAAWYLSVILLMLGMLLSLLKGLDWENTLGLFVISILLVLFKDAFYRHSRLLDIPGSRWLALILLCVLASSAWLVLFVHQDIPYSNELWWQFELNAGAPRSLRAWLASALLLSGLGLIWLMRSPPPVIRTPDAEQRQRARNLLMTSTQPEGGLALTGDKALMFAPAGDAMLMYARRGRSLVALFDPIGSPEAGAELVWAFRDLCDRHQLRPVFYQVRQTYLPFYLDIGLTPFKFGEEALVDLTTFDTQAQGKAMKSLRYTWSRGQRDGLTLRIHEAGQAPMAELEQISRAWLTLKKRREKGFSLGRFNLEYLRHFRIAVLYDQGHPVAFANLLETQRGAKTSLDLMRMDPTSSKPLMEFLILGILLQLRGEGVQTFSLGMAPLSGLGREGQRRFPERLGSLVYTHGESFYNFQGLRRFKEKFQPRWEPVYVAMPAGLDPLWAMLDLAVLIGRRIQPEESPA